MIFNISIQISRLFVPGKRVFALNVLMLAIALAPITRADDDRPTPQWRAAQERAVQMARQGQTSAALDRLRELAERYPQQRAIVYDLAVVAAWQGDDALTVQLLQGEAPASLPTYVLRQYAGSARNIGQWDLAISLYDGLSSRPGQGEAALVGRLLSMADGGQAEQGLAVLAGIESWPQSGSDADVQLRFACGYLHERARQFVAALDCYNKGLRAQPDHAGLRRRRAMVASALGAADIARGELQRAPEVFGPSERERISMDAAAMRIRWAAQQDIDEGGVHYDFAVQQFDRLTAAIDDAEPTKQFDRFVALTLAYRMDEAWTALQDLLQRYAGHEGLPGYVLSSAGRVYLYFQMPRAAIRCYRAALAAGGSRLSPRARFDLQMGLFSALADAGEYAQLAQLVQTLDTQEQPWRRPTPRLWLPNHRYATVAEAAAIERAYVEDYDVALQRMDDMLAIAPANGSMRLSRAAVMRWRGWYQRSDLDLQQVEAGGDYQLRSAVDRGQLALDTQRYAMAQRALTEALTLHGREKSVLDLQRRWQIHNRPELILSADADRSNGGAQGSRGYRVDGLYYSSPIDMQYRLFAHGVSRYADFDEGEGRDARLGAGVEYRRERLTVSAEVNRGLEQFDGTGALLQASWRITDHWFVSAQGQANSMDAPLRGLRAGISADQLSGTLGYRWHESRRAQLALGGMRMEDGNQRRWFSAGFDQRIFNAPRHKLTAQLGAYASRNSEQGAVYFNPERDRELTAGLLHEWRIFRDYEHHLTQRVGLTVGSYYQQDFGSDPLWRLHWEQEWHMSARAYLRYGASYGRRSYDGNFERQARYFITFGARL